MNQTTQSSAEESTDARQTAASAPDKKSARPAPRGHGWLAFWLFLLACTAAGAAGYLYYQLQQAQALRVNNSARITALSQQLAALDKTFITREESSTAVAEVEQQLAQLQPRLLSVEEGVAVMRQAVQGGRAAWLRAELKYLLRLANDQLHIAHNKQATLQALRAADDVLRELTDPALHPVRAAVQKEIAAVAALPAPDVAGMALVLDALAEQAAHLPLKRQAPERYMPPADTAAPATTEAGFVTRLWQGLKNAFSDMVTLRRTATPVAPLLPPEQEYFVRANLRLMLHSARLALLSGDAANFQASLTTALQWLDTWFAADDTGVQSLRTDLQGMQDVELTPQRPDISGSLKLLRKQFPDAQSGAADQ